MNPVRSVFQLASIVLVLCLVPAAGGYVFGQTGGGTASVTELFKISDLDPVDITADTGEKPQSKVWFHDSFWWAAFPNDGGTYLWRLDGQTWTPVLQISYNSSTHADVKAVNGIVHILLFHTRSDTELVSLEYLSDARTYSFWSSRPFNVRVALDSDIETATIDVDSTQRMWLASDGVYKINVRWSDPPYESWSSPITLDNAVSDDDISVVTSLPNQQIGVLWSNQETKRFILALHRDGSSPDLSTWIIEKAPSYSSSSCTDSHMADDHVNTAVGTDGTLYAAIKTGFDESECPKIALLVRHPSGTWKVHQVANSGTRPIVLLNEPLNTIWVVYTSEEDGGSIKYKESSISSISFGSSNILIDGVYNNPTSTKQGFSNEIVILASDESKLVGIHGRGMDYPIDLVTNGSGSIASDPAGNDHPAGTSVSLTASPASGWQFDHWSGDASGTANPVSIVIDGAKSVTAYFKQAQVRYALSSTVSGSGSVTMNPAGGSYPTGTSVAVTATPASGWRFDHWSGDASGTANPVSIVMDGAKSITAYFIQAPGLYTLSSTVDGSGSVTLNPAGGSYAPGTNVTLTATPATGWQFDHWSGDSSGSVNSVSIVMDGAKSATAYFTQPSSPILAGSWQMNEGSGTVLVDSSTYGNHGQIRGVPVWTNGVQLKALSFDGSTNYVSVPHSSSLVFGNAITLVAWIKPGKAATQRIVHKLSGTTGFELYLSADGRVSVRFNYNNLYRLQSTTIYPTDGVTWMHVAATWDGNTIRLYINGIQNNSKSTSFTLTSATNALCIGAESNGANMFKGQMDDVRVYRTALSAADILSLANPSVVYPLSLTANGSGVVVSNPSGASHSAGTIVSLTATPASGWQFDHWSGDASGTANPVSIVMDRAKSVTANFAQTQVLYTLSSTVNGSGSVSLNPAGGSYAPGTSVDLTATSASGWQFDHWGGDVSSITNTASIVMDAAKSITAYFIQPADLSLAGNWLMDEGSGSVLVDSSTYGNHGLIRGTPVWVDGVQLKALSFDGSINYATIPHNSSLVFGNAITLAAWIRPEKMATQRIIKKVTGTNGFELYLSSNGQVSVRFNDSSLYRAQSTAIYPTDRLTWMHVAATWDGSTIRLFINGIQDSLKSTSFTIGNGTGALYIGAENGGAYKFQGQMDDVRVYRTALSAAEILDLATQ